MPITRVGAGLTAAEKHATRGLGADARARRPSSSGARLSPRRMAPSRRARLSRARPAPCGKAARGDGGRRAHVGPGPSQLRQRNAREGRGRGGDARAPGRGPPESGKRNINIYKGEGGATRARQPLFPRTKVSPLRAGPGPRASAQAHPTRRAHARRGGGRARARPGLSQAGKT